MSMPAVAVGEQLGPALGSVRRQVEDEQRAEAFVRSLVITPLHEDPLLGSASHNFSPSRLIF